MTTPIITARPQLRLGAGAFALGCLITVVVFPIAMGTLVFVDEGESLLDGFAFYLLFGAIAAVFVGAPLGVLTAYLMRPTLNHAAHVLAFAVLGWFTSGLFLLIFGTPAGFGLIGLATGISAAVGRAAVIGMTAIEVPAAPRGQRPE